MNYACFADTPLHVLNCLNMAWHDVEGMKTHCDFYIHKQFSGYDKLIDQIEASGIFRGVYVCDMPDDRRESRIWHAIIRMLELFFPKFFLKKWTGRTFRKNTYDVLLMPAPLRFSIALVDLNRKARIWFFEDGSVNYFGDVLDSYGPKAKHLIKILFHKGHEMIVPERMYVNNVQMCHSTTRCALMSLPKIDVRDVGFMKLLDDVFGRGDAYSDKRAIYLSLPLKDIRTQEGVEPKDVFRSTLLPLVPFKDAVVVRPHPREPQQYYEGLMNDSNSTLWELLCARTINEDHILIGYFSTAQLMPKLLFDKEPVLVFTYKLYKPVMPKNNLQELDALISNLREGYRRPERIYNVESIEEYTVVINRLMRNP